MRTPGFTAGLSTGPSLGHYAGRSFFSSSISAGVRQQLRRWGGLGAAGTCCCTTSSGSETCVEGGCDTDCACGCYEGTPICVCSAVSSGGFIKRRF